MAVPANIPDDYIIDSIQVTGQIEKGEHATILEAKWEGRIVAIKGVQSIFDDVIGEELQRLWEHFFTECRLSTRIHHPNIVGFFGIHFPPGAKVPGIVMERLHCDLNNLLERHSVIPLEIKLRVLHRIGLGLRYLHTRDPPIVHKDLTSKNILISEGIEVKIAHLCTARFIPSKHYTRTNYSLDFLPRMCHSLNAMEKEVDIFSFGCIMIHIFSHQWPTPLQALVSSNDEDEKLNIPDSSSELDRRIQYIDKVPKTVEEVVIPLIKGCLENHPGDRPTSEEVCDQLESLVANRKCTLPDTLLQAQLVLQKTQQQLETQTAELQRVKAELLSKNIKLQDEMVVLREEMSKLKVFSEHPASNLQSSKSSKEFWSMLKLTWQQCADLPGKRWVTSVAELDGKVYVSVMDGDCSYTDPFVYDTTNDVWTLLPPLPCAKFSLVAVHNMGHLLAVGGLSRCNDVLTMSDKVYLWDGKTNWVTPYPSMPAGRCMSSVACHHFAVIVAGGISCFNPYTMTRAVEVLHIDSENTANSFWSVVERLPHVVCDAVPLIVDENIYVAIGTDNKQGTSTLSIITASLPKMLQSSNASGDGQVWEKLPDMPCGSFSINHYLGQLITFTGDRLVEKSDEDKAIYELVPLIHMYNPDTKSWDYVGCVSQGYYLGRSVHIKENKILFIGGMSGKHDLYDDDLVPTCIILTINS